MNSVIEKSVAKISNWKPLYWEPVSGTGERLMVGVLYNYKGSVGAKRTLRNEVLQCLYGKEAKGLERIIDHALESYADSLEAIGEIESIDFPLAGIIPGSARRAQVNSLVDLLQVACLLCSSISSIDALDDEQDDIEPQEKLIHKRFTTEVREQVAEIDSDLVDYFGAKHRVVRGGRPVRFGFVSTRALINFRVLRPGQPSASLKAARLALYELVSANEIAKIKSPALIVGVPRGDEPSIGPRQRVKLRRIQNDIEKEFESKGIQLHPVTSPHEGAVKVVELAGS